jgi:hypothetical protein
MASQEIEGGRELGRHVPLRGAASLLPVPPGWAGAQDLPEASEELSRAWVPSLRVQVGLLGVGSMVGMGFPSLVCNFRTWNGAHALSD